MNRNKGILAAMYYLAKVKPKRYRLDHFGTSVRLSEWTWVYTGSQAYKSWVGIESYTFNTNPDNNTSISVVYNNFIFYPLLP